MKKMAFFLALLGALPLCAQNVPFYPTTKSGSFTLLSTTNVSSTVASLAIAVPAGYASYQLISRITPSTAVSDILCAQVNTDTTAGNYYIAGSYQPFTGSASGPIQAFTSAGGMMLGAAQGSSTAVIYTVAAGGGFSTAQGVGGGTIGNLTVASVYAGSQVIPGGSLKLQICTTTGAIDTPQFASGTVIKLYGIN